MNLPNAIQNFGHLDHWPTVLACHFDPQKDLEEGAYIGAGNDEFADLWVVFRCEDKKGVVVLAIESKCHATMERLTAEYFNVHKEKVHGFDPHSLICSVQVLYSLQFVL